MLAVTLGLLVIGIGVGEDAGSWGGSWGEDAGVLAGMNARVSQPVSLRTFERRGKWFRLTHRLAIILQISVSGHPRLVCERLKAHTQIVSEQRNPQCR